MNLEAGATNTSLLPCLQLPCNLQSGPPKSYILLQQAAGLIEFAWPAAGMKSANRRSMKFQSSEKENRPESRSPDEKMQQKKEDLWIESDAATRQPNLVRFSRRAGDSKRDKNR